MMDARSGDAAAGAKKALLIGCSYPGSNSALRGPGYDVSCMQELLATAMGFPADSIRVLRDDSDSSSSSSSGSGMPSQAAILRGFDWLVSDAAQGSNLFLFFSGHGYKARDPTGDETDRLDECILPTDWQQHDGSSGYIRDGQLAQLLLQRLPEGAVLHTLFDCCFSGTLMDLPYEARYNTEQQQSGWTRSSSMSGSHRSSSQPPTAGGKVVQLGACEEDQTAVTSRKLPGVVGTYTGAATHAFVTAIKEHGRHQSYASLLQHMTEALAALGKVSDEGLPEVLADEAAAAADADAVEAADGDSTDAGVLAGELQRAAAAEERQRTAAAGDTSHRPCDQTGSGDAGPDATDAVLADAADAADAAADMKSGEAAKAVFKQQQPGVRRAVGAASPGDATAMADQEAAAAAAAAGPAVESRFDSFGARSPLHDLLELLTRREAAHNAGGTIKAVQVPVLCSDTRFDLDSPLLF